MQTKKVVSVLLAGVTTLSMAMPVLAANGDPNLVVTPDTQYSTPIQANSEVTLGLMPANSYYQRTGFDSVDAAANGLEVSKINLGADKISSVFTYGSKTVDGLYAGTVTVKGEKGQYGPASLHIVNKNNTSAGIDMTVYVEAEETQAPVTVGKVEAIDLTSSKVMDQTAKNVSVAAAKTEKNNPFNGSEGAAQSYPTAGDALYSLAEANQMSFEQNGGYVQSVTDVDENTLEAYTTEDWTYYGWNYCVVRNGEKVAAGDIVSASVLEVEKGDDVYWAFGTMDQATKYFNNLK